jgi:hypothetical protein
MQRKQRIVLVLGATTAVVLAGVLHVILGPVDTLAVAAVAAVLGGLYLVRRAARRAVIYDGA